MRPKPPDSQQLPRRTEICDVEIREAATDCGASEPGRARTAGDGGTPRQAADRVAELVPIRYGRMATTAFCFFRGAAAIMADDLSRSPTTGLHTQLCGDAHLASWRYVGASLGTALVGSVLIAALSTSIIAGIQADPDVPPSVKQATVELAVGVPFLSDTQLRDALRDTTVPEQRAADILDVNSAAPLDALRVAFSLTAFLAIAALFYTGRIPSRPQGEADPASTDRHRRLSTDKSD
jgi:hypothetical protein